MSAWKGKTRGGLLGYRIFVFILKYLGLNLAYFVLLFVSLYFVFFSPQSFKGIQQYYTKIIGHSWLRSIGSIYASYFSFGKTLVDKVAIAAGLEHRYKIDLEEEVKLKEIIAQDKGMILISAHHGNWEMAGDDLGKSFDNPVNVVMYDEEHEEIKEFLNDVKVKKLINVIPIKDDISHLIKINNAISNREIICMHGDRYMEGSRKLEAEFMGHPAEFPFGPFFLASKYDTPVSFVFCYRVANKSYKFHSTKGRVFKGEEPATVLAAFIEELEIKLKKHPEQWYNYYKFWKN